jgi:hypothetical protein
MNRHSERSNRRTQARYQLPEEGAAKGLFIATEADYRGYIILYGRRGVARLTFTVMAAAPWSIGTQDALSEPAPPRERVEPDQPWQTQLHRGWFAIAFGEHCLSTAHLHGLRESLPGFADRNRCHPKLRRRFGLSCAGRLTDNALSTRVGGGTFPPTKREKILDFAA